MSFIPYIVATLFVIAVPLLFHFIQKKKDHPLHISERQLLSQNLTYFVTVYSFILSFSLVSLWGYYNTAETATMKESECVVGMYRLSRGLPNSEKFRTDLIRYAQLVVKEEWPAMRRGETGRETAHVFHDLWDEVDRMKPDKIGDMSHYNAVLQLLISAGQYRIERTLLLDGSLPPDMWVLIFLGGFFSLFGFFFTSTGKLRIQLLFDFMMMCMVVFTIYLVYELDSPFSGSVRVSSKPFSMSTERMITMDRLYK